MKKIIMAFIAVLSTIPFISLAQWTTSGSNIYYNSGKVGVGTSIPPTKLSVYDNTSSLNLQSLIKDGYFDEVGLYNYSNTDYFRTDMSFRRARGSASSPSATQMGDWIGGLNFWAANSGGTFSNPSASIIGIVDGAPSAAYTPGRIVFQTSDGTATTVDRMTLNHNGYLGIGTPNPGYLLDVNGIISSGLAGTTTGGYKLAGSTSGNVTIQPQAAAGTYNFNLPTTAGTAGQVLTSAGGGSSAMTWSTPSSGGSVERLASFYTDVNTITNPGDVYSYTLPANSLTTDGQFIDGQYTSFFYTVNFPIVGGEELKIYFGGQLIFDTGMVSSGAYKITSFKIIKSGTNTARCIINNLSAVDLTGVDFTNTNIIKANISTSGVGYLLMQSGQIIIYR
jgi:hypothetical protein